MQSTKQHSYACLKEQLEAWKDLQLPGSTSVSADHKFLTTVQEILLPELQRLAGILQEGEVDCGIFSGDEDECAVGIVLNSFHAVLRLSPAPNPSYIRAVIAGGCRPYDDLEWFIPYHQIQNGGLARELQAAMLRLLKRRW